nr:uncharacterized protein LOC128780382 [Desmodus rotundus]
MLLLSPALIWHWLPGEGGPEAAAAARPRPPGIFERCSWVPTGWQTWQRRVGQTPKPTTRRAVGAGPGGAGGGSRSVWPLSGQPRRTPGARPGQVRPSASPPRGQAERPRRHVGVASLAGLLRDCRQPGRSGHRGRIVPTLGPAEGQAAGVLPSVLPRLSSPAPPQKPQPSKAAHPNRCPGRLCPVHREPGTDPEQANPASPSLSFPICVKTRKNGSNHQGCRDHSMTSTHRGPSWVPGTPLVVSRWSPQWGGGPRGGPPGCRHGATAYPSRKPFNFTETETDHHGEVGGEKATMLCSSPRTRAVNLSFNVGALIWRVIILHCPLLQAPDCVCTADPLPVSLLRPFMWPGAVAMTAGLALCRGATGCSFGSLGRQGQPVPARERGDSVVTVAMPASLAHGPSHP